MKINHYQLNIDFIFHNGVTYENEPLPINLLSLVKERHTNKLQFQRKVIIIITTSII